MSGGIISTIGKDFSRSPLHYEGGKLYVAERHSLGVYDDLGDLTKLRSFKSTTYGSTYYENHYGYSASMGTNLKNIFYGSNWNGHDAVHQALILSNNFSTIAAAGGSGSVSTLLNVTDLFALNYASNVYPDCGINCDQGPLLGTAPIKYYDGATFRAQGYGGNAVWQSPLEIGALDSGDAHYYDCINNQFIRYSFSSKRFYVFTVTSLSGGTLSCNSSSGNIFHFQNGELYFGNTTGIYRFTDVNGIETSGIATVEPLKIKGRLLKGVTYGDMFIEGKELYYTDWDNGRVLHNSME